MGLGQSNEGGEGRPPGIAVGKSNPVELEATAVTSSRWPESKPEGSFGF